LIDQAHVNANGWTGSEGKALAELGMKKRTFTVLKKQRRLWGHKKFLHFDEGRPGYVSDYELYRLSVRIWDANYRGNELNGSELLTAYRDAHDNSERRRRQMLTNKELAKRGPFTLAEFGANSQ